MALGAQFRAFNRQDYGTHTAPFTELLTSRVERDIPEKLYQNQQDPSVMPRGVLFNWPEHASTC
jgi:hypothetical protein